MKVLALVLLLSAPMQTMASGCLGGDWQVISEETVPPTAMHISYSQGEVEFSLRLIGSLIYITWPIHIEADQPPVSFSGGDIGVLKYNFSELFAKMHALYPQFMANTTKTVEKNAYYDDCEDIPENTQRTTMTYTFEVPLQNGKVKFQGYRVSYDPPIPE